jgi:phosphomannomutase
MKEILFLFDVDGTLTKPRNKIDNEMIEFIKKIKNKNIKIGIISGSDFKKIEEQLTFEIMNLFDYIFTENGLVSFFNQKCIHQNNMINEIGEKNYQDLINDILKILSEINLPIKRGNFIELRSGMLNISPIGRSCNQIERENFYLYDCENKIRKTIIEKLKKYETILDFSIGGQISIDIFPKNWNKTYCLQFLNHELYSIYFFGDKMMPGGNDYELSCDSRVIPINIINPSNLIEKINSLFFS